jgi:hypothetical protein
MVGIIPVFAILIANIFTIWNIRWGYEIKSLAVESIILCIVIFALETYEYRLHRKQQPKYLAPHQYVTKLAKKQVNVMAADEESDIPVSNEVGILKSVIKRLTEAEQLSKLEYILNAADQADSVAEEVNRQKLLNKSTIAKQKQFREKRKGFERHRLR